MVDDIIQLSHEFQISKFGHIYGQTNSVSFSFCYNIAILVRILSVRADCIV